MPTLPPPATNGPLVQPTAVPKAEPIRVLVVDDSSFVRKLVREILSSAPGIEVVGVARDGEEALELCAALKPDLITCDLMMPGLDGVGFVRAQMARRPLRILILSAAPQHGDVALEALNAGAVDLVQKPTALSTDLLRTIGDELIAKVRGAMLAPVAKLLAADVRPVAPLTMPPKPTMPRLSVDMVVLGVSTGGPQALRYLLPRLPVDLAVPLVMVLHMPVGYTALFAEKLNEVSPIKVTEAREGDVFEPGHAYLAPAGLHLRVRRNASAQMVASLSMNPTDKPHRPSVDVLFRSAADVLSGRVLGVVMTGMGNDGKEGAGWIKASGGTVITETESSCIIYGMPRCVVEAGLSDAAVPLSQMAEAIVERI